MKITVRDERLEGSHQLNFPPSSVLVLGYSVDDRGDESTSIESSKVVRRCYVLYDHETMELMVDGERINAERATEIFSDIFSEHYIVLDSTTLGFVELFYSVQAALDIGRTEFKIIYLEPKDYTRNGPAQDSFALSEKNAGFLPIPRAITDLSSQEVEAGVFFLGYESNRLERALEDHQMLSDKDLKLVVGVPAFQSGWELNSMVPHLDRLREFQVSYCAANDPDSALEALEDTFSSISDGSKMFVAPIGTKPCSIAAALFSAIHPDRVGLLYDHRKKKKKRSSGVHVWHEYAVSVYEE